MLAATTVSSRAVPPRIVAKENGEKITLRQEWTARGHESATGGLEATRWGYLSTA
jgi:hypothetical protein